MRIAIASDHAGFSLKEDLRIWLAADGHEVVDLGTGGKDSCDYPDFAFLVAREVSSGSCRQGILVCGTGLGMAMAANRCRGVRAAVCDNTYLARLSRLHNDAQILAVGSRVVAPEYAREIVQVFLDTEFEGDRHSRRLQKMDRFIGPRLGAIDPEVLTALHGEACRQQETLELIASENFVSPAVLESMGSVLTNKYAEGYPGRRYYGGCEHMDVVERLAIERAKEIFGADHANVQPHSGSSANMAVYFGFLKPGDKLMGMDLSSGGHLTHGHHLSYSGRDFEVVAYGVDRETELIDYDQVERLAQEHRPRMIVCGASAYSRVIDFQRFREIADSVDAYLMADMAHIAGLVAAEVHPSPVPHCHFVTTTTHKTLRGPRGGMILCQKDLAKQLDRAVFPGIQGGPLMHLVAAKAVALKEASQPSFVDYQHQVVKNAASMARVIQGRGLRIVSGGTDNHLFLVDVASAGTTGRTAETALEDAGITTNKNTIPYDPNPPLISSGIRIGTAAVTTRGMGQGEMELMGNWIADIISDPESRELQKETLEKVQDLCSRFLLPP